MLRRCLQTFLCSLLLVPFSLTAGQIVLDFEGFSDSMVLTNQYPGVTFTNTIILTAGISLNEFEFPPYSGVNVASDNDGSMTLTFASSITSFGGYFTYAEPLRIDAFNAANAIVASATSTFSNNEALSGDLGSSPDEFIQVSFASGISSVTITGDPLGGSFVIDNATYTTAGTGVPEPSSWTLFALSGGLLALCWFVRRRRRHLRLLAQALRRTSVAILFILLSLASGHTLWANSPTVGTPSAFPAVIASGVPSSTTITVAIPGTSVISNGVNLLQFASPGSPPLILGQMHDDGQNGDAVAGDGIFTLVVPLDQPMTGTFQMQVSAAFRGVLKRVLSPAITINVTVTGTLPLPPDPGPAGMATLNGIDSDGDGVRDDVQRYIALIYPSSAKTRSALTQLAKGYLSKIADNATLQLAQLDSQATSYGIDCLFLTLPSTATQTLLGLEGQILNTQARISAYLGADSAVTSVFYELPKGSQQLSRCMVNPNTLPNGRGAQ